MIGISGSLSGGGRSRVRVPMGSPPVLSLPVDTANGPTSGSGGCTTDSLGTLYVVALLSADSTPTAAQIAAGNKADGTPAPWAWSQTVTVSGAQTIAYSAATNAQMLAPETGYKFAFAQTNTSSQLSNVVVGDGFTTLAVLSGGGSVGITSITNPFVVGSLSIPVAVGDAITVMTAEQSGTITVTAVTDNLGNTYTACNAGLVAGGTNSSLAFRSIATVAGTLTTVNIAATASTNDAAADVQVFRGPFSAVDAEPAIRGDGTSPMTGTATGTLAQASELVVGMMASTSTGATIGASTDWTLCGTPAATGARRASTIYRNVSDTTSVTPSFTLSGGSDTAAVQTISFKRAA